ncbi:MAG: hypothetical protein WA231_12045 [Methylocella sp.]
MTFLTGAGLAKRDNGVTRLRGWAFAAVQAPDKVSEASFRPARHPERLVCRSGPAKSEGQANDSGIAKRKACKKRIAAREIPELHW